MSHYLVGIDLGTTNIALAYVDVRKARRGQPEIKTFAIPQLVAAGEMGVRPLLPSFIYLPGPHDLPAGATALPWDADRREVVGEFARNHGAKIPGRLITSAKSWLCHAGVDRSAPLLPWSAPPDVPRISPVDASARYLRHLVESWNDTIARDKPEDHLEKQAVVLTVPASFDDVARNLTVEAAHKAGLTNVTLLEEPQAAFYSWLAQHTEDELGKLRPGMNCLVVDIGGGTTDFSLIQCVEEGGEFGFIRKAVGDHLLLGGDNMDLALAKFVENKLPGAGRLDAAQYGVLTQACRTAKEVLLGENPPATHPVTVTGRGRALVGGTQHTNLSPAEVHQAIFEGFFPIVRHDAAPQSSGRAGLHEMGLPYVNDPAITRHLAAFLSRHSVVNSEEAPAAILFNGGVFQPAALRERLIDVMRGWYKSPQKNWKPLLLTNPSLDLAVAWGAAQFAWIRHSGGRRIGGGIARSYYIAVDDTLALAANSVSVVCVVPRRLEEGREIVLSKPEMELALGQPVAFPLYTSTVRGEDHAGDVLTVKSDQLLRLPPLHTVLRGGKRSATKMVPVTLAARCSEIGTLELWCTAKDGNNRWRLEFNVRDIVSEDRSADAEENRDQVIGDVWPEAQVQAADQLIRATYQSEPDSTHPRELTKAIEAAVDAPRSDWPTGLCRRLWDALLQVANDRRQSPSHLARWYYLVGYCLRPGFGDVLDRFRVEQLWKLLHAPGRADSKAVEGGADYWIMWRRVAGGLNVTLQQSLADRLRPTLLPAKGKGAAKPGANELAEMWRAVASLERLSTNLKEQLGQTLLKQVRKSPAPTYGFWALTRLGARALLYGPLNAVVHPEVVQGWLDGLVQFRPAHQSERLAWAFCLSQLARQSGQRALDIDDVSRAKVLQVLKSLEIPSHWIRMVEEYSELESAEQTQMFGDSLPIGLRLIGSRE